MAKLLVIFSLLLAVTIIGSSVSSLPKNISFKVVTSEQMKDILKQYPNAFELERKVQSQEKQTRDVVLTYTFGARVTGDFLLSHQADGDSWGETLHVVTWVSFPENEEDQCFIVSFVNVFVVQSNEKGRAYVLLGGIGERSISILIEAEETSLLEYSINFYGY